MTVRRCPLAAGARSTDRLDFLVNSVFTRTIHSGVRSGRGSGELPVDVWREVVDVGTRIVLCLPPCTRTHVARSRRGLTSTSRSGGRSKKTKNKYNVPYGRCAAASNKRPGQPGLPERGVAIVSLCRTHRTENISRSAHQRQPGVLYTFVISICSRTPRLRPDRCRGRPWPLTTTVDGPRPGGGFG